MSQGASFNSQKVRIHKDLRNYATNNANASARGTLG